MAIAKAGTDVSAQASSVSHTLVAGSNRKVIICVESEGDTTGGITGVTYGGVACTLATDGVTPASVQQDTGTRNEASEWFIDEADLPADGARTAQASFSTARAAVEISVSQYNGMAQGQSLNTDGDGAASTTVVTNASLAAIGADEWAISCAGCGSALTWTHSDSQVEIAEEVNSSSSLAVAELRGGSSETSLSSTASSSTSRLVRVVAVWGPAAGGQPARSMHQFRMRRTQG